VLRSVNKDLRTVTIISGILLSNSGDLAAGNESGGRMPTGIGRVSFTYYAGCSGHVQGAGLSREMGRHRPDPARVEG
jgi:hypothetical protein